MLPFFLVRFFVKKLFGSKLLEDNFRKRIFGWKKFWKRIVYMHICNYLFIFILTYFGGKGFGQNHGKMLCIFSLNAMYFSGVVGMGIHSAELFMVSMSTNESM